MVLRGLIFAAVVFASAAAGLVASRLWPLPQSLTPTLKIGDGPPRSEQKRRSQPIEDTSAARPLADRSQTAAKHEVSRPSESPPASLTLLNPGAADEPPEVEQASPPAAKDVDEAKPQPIRPALQAANENGSRPTAPRQRKYQAQASEPRPPPPTSSPNHERDAAVRDFMSHNPPFRH
jgi:cytoskeletal protein RodZ